MIDLPDLVGGLPGLLTLEKFDRQADQTLEDQQVQLGVQLRRQHHFQHLAAESQQQIEGDAEHQDHGHQRQRVAAMVLDHRADGAHHQQDRQDAEHGDGDRTDRDVAQDAPVGPDQPRQHGQVEGAFVFAFPCRADQQHLTVPGLAQP